MNYDNFEIIIYQDIRSEGVINLFSDAKKEINLFDEAFLEEIAAMKQKNLVAELLKKLIAEQITVYKKTNLVKSELFSEMLKRLMNSYRNGLITNAEVIDELLKMAEQMANDHKEGESLGLTTEEKAFYDALTKPEALKDFYTNEELVAITKELTEQLRKSRTIDWEKKESARAAMRSMVKRLLKKHRYPPDELPNATEAVLAQCEQWAETAE